MAVVNWTHAHFNLSTPRQKTKNVVVVSIGAWAQTAP